MTDDFSGWLFEAGIGENRAALILGSELVRVRIERETSHARVGAIVDAKFTKQWVAGRSGIVTLPSGQEALLQPLPVGLTEGVVVRVELVREAARSKHDQAKRARVKPALPQAQPQVGIALLQELEATGYPVKQIHPHEDDLLQKFGWHEAIEQAETGRVQFEGGSLQISITPAMTVIDVDGPLPSFELAKRAAKEISLSLVRLNITGNIGVDFPTLVAKTERNVAAQIFDDHMPEKCERTAINGFGFMQIVSRKMRPSLIETMQTNRTKNAALGLLRQTERDRGNGGLQLTVHPAVANKLKQDWIDELARRTGRAIAIASEGKLPLNGGHITAA